MRLATFNIATFNVASGRSFVDGRIDMRRFAAAIGGLDADVLALQEVDRDQPRSGRMDLTQVAAEAMGAAERVFAPALYGTPGDRWTRADGRAQPGAAYGCALLSRHPLRDVEIVRLPAAPVAVPLWMPRAGLVVVREEPRVAVVATVEAGWLGPINVVATHPPFVPGWNRWQLRRLARRAEQRSDPVLIMGDLNLRGSAPARITGYRSLCHQPTFPAHRPRMQLDHILLRGRLDAARVGPASTPEVAVSDHRPVLVELTYSRPDGAQDGGTG